MKRIYAVDVLRGIVMIIMALDHVRDYFHATAFTQDPLDAATTTPALYFTRWITHFCAPVFVLLSGLSIHLMHNRRTKAEISRYLFTRGLWLILVEITIMSFALTFNPQMNVLILQVIWAIGISFVVLSGLIFLPWQVILGVGLLITAGHNALDALPIPPGTIWEFVHQTKYTLFTIMPGRGFLVLYPFLPFTGILLCGYGLGRAFLQDVSPAARKKLLITAGTVMILLFLVLRGINVYGDPAPWKELSVYTFLNVTKYPASLLFTCITIGPGLLLLAALEGKQHRLTDIAKVYGSVPFFYYILHFYLIHTLCMIVFFLRGHTAAQISSPMGPFYCVVAGVGFSLGGVYLVWFSVVAALYLPCRWYSGYRQRHRYWWLSYL